MQEITCVFKHCHTLGEKCPRCNGAKKLELSYFITDLLATPQQYKPTPYLPQQEWDDINAQLSPDVASALQVMSDTFALALENSLVDKRYLATIYFVCSTAIEDDFVAALKLVGWDVIKQEDLLVMPAEKKALIGYLQTQYIGRIDNMLAPTQQFFKDNDIDAVAHLPEGAWVDKMLVTINPCKSSVSFLITLDDLKCKDQV